MSKLPTSTGWLWIKQGFALFRKQPGGLSTLFIGYMLATILLSMVPVAGQFMPVVLVPVFSIAFMQACADIDQNKRVLPKLLLAGFRQPAFKVLFALGTLYLAAFALAIAVSALADDGVLFKLLAGQLETDSAQAREANLGGAFLLALAVYLPVAMAFCFAAPLIYWQRMSLGKAVFFSFFAVLRALRAFAAFALGWFTICMTVALTVALLCGGSDTARLVMLPLSIIMTVVINCSFYASYRQIFGVPQDEAPAAPPPVSGPPVAEPPESDPPESGPSA